MNSKVARSTDSMVKWSTIIDFYFCMLSHGQLIIIFEGLFIFNFVSVFCLFAVAIQHNFLKLPVYIRVLILTKKASQSHQNIK